MFIITTEEENIMEEKEKIFWFYVEDADALDETEVPVYSFGGNNLETDAEYGKETEEDNRYIELPILDAEELLNVDEPLVISNGFNGMAYLYLPEQWEEMWKFLESRDRKQWRSIKRYIYGTSYQVEVQDRRLYIPKRIIKNLKIQDKAVLMKFTKDRKYYYALRNDSL